MGFAQLEMRAGVPGTGFRISMKLSAMSCSFFSGMVVQWVQRSKIVLFSGHGRPGLCQNRTSSLTKSTVIPSSIAGFRCFNRTVHSCLPRFGALPCPGRQPRNSPRSTAARSPERRRLELARHLSSNSSNHPRASHVEVHSIVGKHLTTTSIRSISMTI